MTRETNSNLTLFNEALAEAKLGYSEGGIPIGSVLVYNNKVIGRGHNRRIQNSNPILHAEIDAIQNAGRHPAAVYSQCTLYTTLSPCDMCTGAILLFRIPRVVIGENRTFVGGEDLLKSRGVELTLLDNEDCYRLLQEFTIRNPQIWNEDIGL